MKTFDKFCSDGRNLDSEGGGNITTITTVVTTTTTTASPTTTAPPCASEYEWCISTGNQYDQNFSKFYNTYSVCGLKTQGRRRVVGGENTEVRMRKTHCNTKYFLWSLTEQ